MSLRVKLARIKRNMFQKPWLKDKRYPGFWCEQLLGNVAASVVQIGSNDGKTGDPLYELFQRHGSWKGLFVEPVPYLFQRLKGNYPDASRFRFANVAVSCSSEPMEFYWVDPAAREAHPDLPYWFDQLGSFDKSRITEELDGKLEPFLRSAPVQCLDLPTLLQRNSIDSIDLLHIDTEGHDWAILSQLDLQAFQPKLLLFEYNHLSEADFSAALAFLRPHYQLFDVGIDVFAVHQSVGANTLQAMQQNMKAL